MFYSSNMKELEAADRILYGDAAVASCPGYDPISIGAYPYRHKGVDDKALNELIEDRERDFYLHYRQKKTVNTSSE